MGNKGKILSIDFGDKAVGLALCDRERVIVYPFKVIRSFKSMMRLFQQLYDICAIEEIVEVIWGIPLGEDGNKTLQSQRIQKFGNDFSHYLSSHSLSLPLHFIDESFTSYEAQQLAEEQGIQKIKEKGLEDSLAATILLTRYLKS